MVVKQTPQIRAQMAQYSTAQHSTLSGLESIWIQAHIEAQGQCLAWASTHPTHHQKSFAWGTNLDPGSTVFASMVPPSKFKHPRPKLKSGVRICSSFGLSELLHGDGCGTAPYGHVYFARVAQVSGLLTQPTCLCPRQLDFAPSH